jgi:hypothetical protein
MDTLGTQEKMDKAFGFVDPVKRGRKDWKEQILAWVPAEELEAAGLTIADVEEAVRFYTATEPKTERLEVFGGGHGYYVEAKGYRRGPAGDH